MSFRMTNSIIIGNYKPFKCSSVTWKRSMDNYTDSAKIVIPAMCRVKCDRDYGPIVPTGMQFNVGDPVKISCGYNGNNHTQFVGFISRINFNVPLEIECEGYSYKMREARFTRTYKNTSIRRILEDITQGTSIKVSSKIPEVEVTKAQFINFTGVQILDWFKEKMLQTVYFNFDELYVGLRYASLPDNEVKHRLNWNVIDDSGLVFDRYEEAIVNIQLEGPLRTGGYHKVKPPKDGAIKKKRLQGLNIQSQYAIRLRDDLQKIQNFQGFSGTIVTFLEPFADLNMTSNVTDGRYGQRTGRKVIEAIEGSFDPGGGRQKLTLGISV